MDFVKKIVEFHKFCKTCKYKDVVEYEDPCNDCLDNPVNDYSKKPVNYKEEEK